MSKNIAENLLSLKTKRGLTQTGLAHISGCTRAAVALVESGSSNPTLDVLLKISQGLRVSIDELLSSPRVDCLRIKAKDFSVDRRSKSGVRLRKLLPCKIHATERDEIQMDSGATMTEVPHIEMREEVSPQVSVLSF